MQTNKLGSQAALSANCDSGINSHIEGLKVLAWAMTRRIHSLGMYVSEREPVALNLCAEVQHFEAELIRSALVRTGGRQRRAARLLGMKVTTLNTKIKRYQINVNADIDRELGVANDLAQIRFK